MKEPPPIQYVFHSITPCPHRNCFHVMQSQQSHHYCTRVLYSDRPIPTNTTPSVRRVPICTIPVSNSNRPISTNTVCYLVSKQLRAGIESKLKSTVNNPDTQQSSKSNRTHKQICSCWSLLFNFSNCMSALSVYFWAFSKYPACMECITVTCNTRTSALFTRISP